MPSIDGHEITITHPEKVVFPADGITKGELAEYFQSIAPRMIPHVRDRPLHMNRYPGGIQWNPIQQKRVPDSFPAWIERATVEMKGGTITHVLVNNAATIVYLAQYNVVTVHVWLSRIQAITQPDMVMFDLDPADEDFAVVRKTALALKTMLEDLQLVPFVKTTGSRGLHVIAPITVGPTFHEVHLFADAVAQRLAADDPDHLTTEFLKEKRGGRLFLDVNRNAYAQTAVAPYAVRAKAGAPIAVPVDWSEVESSKLRPDGVGVRSIATWLKGRDDPWRSMERSRKPLPSLKDSEKPDRSGRRKGVSRKRPTPGGGG